MPESTGCRLAVLFAYNAAGFDALERTKGAVTIEGTLLSVLATLLSTDGKATFTNISRASTTEVGEHASRQVVSFEIANAAAVKIPPVELINQQLPAGIRVFRIVPVSSDFSARRTCEARTYEYLIPTYAFAPPPAATAYAYPDLDDDDMPMPDANRPRGGLFKTMKRGQSLARRQTMSRSSEALIVPDADAPPVPALPDVRTIKRPSPAYGASTAPASPRAKMEQLQIDNADGETHEDRGFVSRMFASFANAFRGKKAWPSGSDQLKAHLSATLQRSKSYPAPRGQDLRSAAKDAALEPELADDSIVGTLKRSLSRHRNFDPREFHSEVETRFFDPLDIPAPNSEQRASMRGYRMTKSQKEALRNIIALFNGTHNWHNYIPGASHDDSRCYIRILNLDLTDVEQHDGMEWIRFKVQAPAFARYQIRRMVALMIMVVRTNTPRSVIANSYGIAKIEIPEAPGFPLIFDEPHFNNYNVEALKKAAEPVNFGPSIEAVEAFRRDAIHNAIYAYERDAMEFDSWLRSLDNYSFLYTYFLNERGVISKPGNFVRQPDAKAATVAA